MTAISFSLRAAMMLRGWAWSDFGRALDMNPVAARAVSDGIVNSGPTRRRIEILLNKPLWETPQNFIRFAKIAQFIGGDPILAPLPSLRRMAFKAGVCGAKKMKRPEILSALEALLPAEPAAQSAKSENAEK